MHRRSAVRVLAVVVLSAAVAGCSSSGGGSPLVPSGSGGSGGSSSSGTPAVTKGVDPDTSSVTPPTPSPTTPTPTPGRSTRAGTPPPGLRDFGDVTFSVPSGFAVTAAYSPITPLESDYRTHYVAPTSATSTKEVISMAVYTLPASRTITAGTDQVARIRAYNTRAKAVVSSSGIRKAASTIDGLPAYTETATETGNAGSVTYIAYWVFGTHHFLQYSCQLGATSAVGSLAVACGTTLASLQLT